MEKRRSEADNGYTLPWQAQGENAAEKSSAKDLAEALYGIVGKHPEPEDVLYARLTMHRKDGSNAFKQALSAFGATPYSIGTFSTGLIQYHNNGRYARSMGMPFRRAKPRS